MLMMKHSPEENYQKFIKGSEQNNSDDDEDDDYYNNGFYSHISNRC